MQAEAGRSACVERTANRDGHSRQDTQFVDAVSMVKDTEMFFSKKRQDGVKFTKLLISQGIRTGFFLKEMPVRHLSFSERKAAKRQNSVMLALLVTRFVLGLRLDQIDDSNANSFGELAEHRETWIAGLGDELPSRFSGGLFRVAHF